MISFKHILITFTVLSVSIWFMPVISPPRPYTAAEKQLSCIRFLKDCTHYENKIGDYNKTESSADIKFTFDAIIRAGVDVVTAPSVPTDLNEALIAVGAFIRFMIAMDKGEHVVKGQAVEVAEAVRKAYTEDLKLVNINNRKPNPAQIFCESKITTGKNEILGIITQVLTS